MSEQYLVVPRCVYYCLPISTVQKPLLNINVPSAEQAEGG